MPSCKLSIPSRTTAIRCAFLVLAAASFFMASAYCTTSGQNIVDRATRTQVVVPHGVGVGGWLEPEGYMWGSNKYDRPRLMEQAISDLIGPAAADSFWILYHWNFFTEADVKACKGWGMNMLRIPLLASLIQPYDSQPSAPPYKYKDEGWRILDSLVIWCERWQLGIIWDMHCPPGSENGQNISDAPANGNSTLWTDTATYWPRTKDLWFKIADRYKSYQCIVGYDLLNEPLLTSNGFNGSLLRKIYMDLTDAIRTVDTVGIIFVEGQWWARDFTIIEPINWDKHLAIAYHEYNPMITSCSNMKGSASGNSWDACAARTKYNIPLWLGETGEQGPPYTINAQSTDFLNANNIGWSWWNEKKFDSQNSPWNCPKTSGFKTILNYWNNGGTKPNADSAKKWLFDQARRTTDSYCTFCSAMVTSLHPLDPNGKVPVMQTAVPKHAGIGHFSNKAGALSFELPVAQKFSVEILDMRGRSVYRAVSSGTKLGISGRLFPAGLYIVRAAGDKTSLQPRVVLLHP
jgi:endoglucanase